MHTHFQAVPEGTAHSGAPPALAVVLDEASLKRAGRDLNSRPLDFVRDIDFPLKVKCSSQAELPALDSW